MLLDRQERQFIFDLEVDLYENLIYMRNNSNMSLRSCLSETIFG